MTGERELRATVEAINRALGENDTKTLSRLYAEDYRGHSIRGEVESRVEILGAFAPGGVSGYRMAELQMEAEVHGSVGLVSGSGVVSGTCGGAGFNHRVRFLEVYLWRDSRWQCYRSQCTEIKSE